MQFTTLTLTTLLSLATALPTTTTPASTPGGVKFCTGENGDGQCNYGLYEFNTCYTLPAPYYKNVGSMAVDSGAYCRITYTADTCTLHGDAFVNPPGEMTLHHFENGQNETVDAGAAMTSFLCQECTNCV